MMMPLGELGVDHVTVRLKGLSCKILTELGGEPGPETMVE